MPESESFDLIVLGTGTAGQGPAYAAAEAGWSVAAVDPNPPGGTCPNRGCDAKKPLVNAAAAVDFAQRMTGHGIGGPPSVDWQALMRFKRSFTDPIPDNTRKDLENAGIILVQGAPRFTDRHTIAVGDRQLTAKKFVIATGLRPRELGFPGAEHTVNSDEFLELEKLPHRVLMIGGGYIGMEFAHVCARLGREVTIVEKSGCPMKNFDDDMSARLRTASEDVGITLHCDQCVDGIERSDDGTLVATCSQTGQRYDADLIVNASGRAPSLDGMDLETAGIETTDKGIKVDAKLRSTSRSDVFAAGDIADTGYPQLTPASGFEGKAMTHNLLHEDDQQDLEHWPIASIVFSLPKLASVGISEKQAREQGKNFDVVQGDASGFKDNRQQNIKHAAYKVLIDKDTDLILGATYLGYDADQHINLVALGMTHGLTSVQLRKVLYAYPTPGATLPSTLK